MITCLNTVCLLTCGIQPVESGHGITVKHPEVAIVTGQQAGLARCHNVIPNNVATRGGARETETRVEKHQSAKQYGAPVKVLTLVAVYYLTYVCSVYKSVRSENRPHKGLTVKQNCCLNTFHPAAQYSRHINTWEQ